MLRSKFRNFLLVCMAMLMTFTAFSQSKVFAAEDQSVTLASWNYNSAPTTPAVPANGGVNASQSFLTNYKNGLPDFSSQSLRITDWSQGSEKYWKVSFSTTGYENLTLSNDQRSSSTAPRDFKLQYSINDVDWIDVPDVSIPAMTATLSKVLDNVKLPSALNNQPTAYIRWLVSSDKSVSDADIRDGGTSNINNIVINGTVIDSNPQNLSFSVLATSDVHGRILNYDYTKAAATDNYGLVKIASYVKSQRELIPNLIVMDNGDAFQGTPLSLIYLGKAEEHPMALAMRYIGYDAWVLGNHEFNYGLDVLNKFIEDISAPAQDGRTPLKTLSANTYKTSDNSNYVDPFFIKTFKFEDGSSVNVGVLGLTTPNIPSWESSKNYAGLYFAGSITPEADMSNEANKWIPIMKAQGADIIVVSFHSGIENTVRSSNENQIRTMISKCTGIDAVISGHSHSANGGVDIQDADGKNVRVVNPGSTGSNVSKINFVLEKANGKITVKSVDSANVPMNNINAPVDADLNNILAPYQATALAYNSRIIGEAGAAFPKPSLEKPSAIIDIVHFAQMAASNAQLSITAPLSTSTEFAKGPLSVKDAGSAYVYENTLYVIKMSGANIKGWMELVAQRYSTNGTTISFNSSTYNADCLYGATYDMDLTAPVGSRIKNLRYQGRLVQDTDTFNVAINNYRFAGEYMTAAGLTPDDQSLVVWDSALELGSDDGQVRSMVIDYIEKHGTIYPEIKSDWTISKTSIEQTADILLNKNSLTLALNDSEKLSYSGYNDIKVTWTSSDASVATVDENGLVKAVGNGTAEIKASIDNRIYDTCKVVVGNSKADLAVKLTIDAKLVKKGELFKVKTELEELAASNVVVLNYKYDKAKFSYQNIELPNGTTVISAEETSDGVKIILMIPDYKAKSLGDLVLLAHGDISPAKEANEITVDVNLVVKDAEGNKSILSSSSSATFETGKETNIEGDIDNNGVVDLIDLSEIIDAFGIDNTHKDWVSLYAVMDFNKNGVIDIQDIIYLANKIVKAV